MALFAEGGGLPDVSALPPWLAVPVLILAIVAGLGTALGPPIREHLKHRNDKRPVARTQIEQKLDYASEFIADLKRQRDRAEERAGALQDELDQAQADIADRDVQIAQLKARRRA